MRQAKPVLIRGAVTHLQQYSHVSGAGNVVGTTYDTTFSIGLQHVQLSTSSPPAIQEGDDVAVAGNLSANGILYSGAYRNVTRNVRPDKPSDSIYAFGICMLIVLPITVFFLMAIFFGVAGALVISPFSIVALAFGLNGLQRANASRSAFFKLASVR